MPRKKKQETKEEIKETEKKVSVTGILMGTGRRKTSVARVWLKNGKGPIQFPVPGYQCVTHACLLQAFENSGVA